MYSFFNKLCSSGARKNETADTQHKVGTAKEMLTKNDVTNAKILWFQVLMESISAMIPTVK